jgi:hypothetical protein
LMDTTQTGWKPAEVDCCVYIFYKSVYGNRPHFLKFMLTMSMCSEIHPKISFFFIKNKCKKCQINWWSCFLSVSPRFLCRPTTLYIIARAVERQSAIYTEKSGFASPTLGQHISTFRGYRILFSIRNPYINRFTNHFSIHS